MLEQTMRKERGMVNRKIASFFSGIARREKVPLVRDNYREMREFVMRGGKRLRPICTVMAYRGVGGIGNRIYLPALSVELLHNATLLHDDMMDNDPLRRGKPTYHVKFKSYFEKRRGRNGAKRFGRCMATIGGNILYSLGIGTITESKFGAERVMAAADKYEKTFVLLNHGQMEDIDFETRKRVSEKDYMRMITGKTAELFSCSLEIGAIMGGATDKRIRKLRSYAVPMAQSFQIQDDVLGVFAEQKTLGKPVGSDIRNGKNTLLLIKARELADRGQLREIGRIFGNDKATAAQIRRAKQLLDETGALAYAEKKSMALARRARVALKKARLKKGSHLFFDGFSDYVIARGH